MLCNFEGLRLKVYTDVAGYATIGYGHKLTEDEIASGVYAHGITKVDADAILDRDVGTAERSIRQVINVALNPNQSDALVCLVFNVGAGLVHGKAPKLTAALQSEHWQTAANEMRDIDKRRDPKTGALVVDAGLHARRAVEAALFLSPVDDIDHETVMASVGVSLDAIAGELAQSWIHGSDPLS